LLKFTLLVIGCFIVLLEGAWIVSAQTGAPSRDNKQDPPFVRYDAEEGLPQDKAGEKRRDNEVLEAALNDLANAKNPEYKYFIQNRGPGKEVVINDRTLVADRFIDMMLALDKPNRNIDGNDIRIIPIGVQEDFKRRSKAAASSLADFKPANPVVVVEDLDQMLEEPDGFLKDALGAIRKKYPNTWGYVWAYPPGYSKDGKSAVMIFDAPGGRHGGDWVYMLSKKGKRWEVVWRHCHNYR
jgi:hypothetical protein